MDIIILKHLKNNHAMSGYDVIKYFHEKFHILPSSGTVYSILYALERQRLIEGSMIQGKRVYKLTNEGEKRLDNIRIAKPQIKVLISYILSQT
jgi:DNA-binding PadR family transcriptional regulator